MPIEVKIIKDNDEGKVGDIINFSKGSAKSLVEQGYAEYVKEKIKTPKVKKESKTTKEYLSDEDLIKEIKNISKLNMPLEINKALRNLKNKTKYPLTELQKQLNYTKKESGKGSVTLVTGVTGVTGVTDNPKIKDFMASVTTVTHNTNLFNSVFSDSNIDLICKEIMKCKRPLTFGELALKLKKSEVNIRNTISRNKHYLATFKTDSKICYTYLLHIFFSFFEERIEQKKQEIIDKKEKLEQEKKQQELQKNYENEVASFLMENNFKREGRELIFDFDILSKQNNDLSISFLNEPERFLNAVKGYYDYQLELRIINLPYSNQTTIEGLRKEHCNKVISLDGRVVSFGEVKPIVTETKYECPSCGTIIKVSQDYKIGFEREPFRCSCGRRGGFKLYKKEEINSCFIRLEDLQEKTDNPYSQRIKAVVFNKLTDRETIKVFTPGNEVKCIGILKQVPIFKAGKKSLFSDWIFEIINVELLDKDLEIEEFSDDDLNKIDEISEEVNKKGVSFLLNSFAPDIYGYESIKSALILQLCNRRNFKTNGNQRNKSNVLLVGDPGVAKSVLCDFSVSVCGGARKAVGGGSSAVGITASVVKEEDALGGFRVEPGAMVLAKELLFLDELNNLHDDDKPKLQEGMSEQTISINKANLHVQMKVSCGILAVANPMYGHFKKDSDKNMYEQFNIPSPILNRFDTIFMIQDSVNEIQDKMIAEKMINRYRGEIKTKYNRDILRKFFSYVRNTEEPKIEDDVQEILKELYFKARKISSAGVKINPRFLEALTRMSVSHAKLRQSKVVEEKDLKATIKILSKSQYNLQEDILLSTINNERIMKKCNSCENNAIKKINGVDLCSECLKGVAPSFLSEHEK